MSSWLWVNHVSPFGCVGKCSFNYRLSAGVVKCLLSEVQAATGLSFCSRESERICSANRRFSGTFLKWSTLFLIFFFWLILRWIKFIHLILNTVLLSSIATPPPFFSLFFFKAPCFKGWFWEKGAQNSSIHLIIHLIHSSCSRCNSSKTEQYSCPECHIRFQWFPMWSC